MRQDRPSAEAQDSPFKKLAIEVMRMRVPRFPSSPHPESGGNWRKVRKEERDA